MCVVQHDKLLKTGLDFLYCMGAAPCSGKYAQALLLWAAVNCWPSLHQFFGKDMPTRSDYLQTGGAGETPITRALPSRAHPPGNSSRHGVESPEGARVATATPQAEQKGPSNDAGNASVSSNSPPDQPPHLMPESLALPSYWVSSIAGIHSSPACPGSLVQCFLNPHGYESCFCETQAWGRSEAVLSGWSCRQQAQEQQGWLPPKGRCDRRCPASSGRPGGFWLDWVAPLLDKALMAKRLGIWGG